MTAGLHDLTIAAGAEQLRRRTLSPVAWLDALLKRIAALDGELHAFLTVTAAQARAAAETAEREIAAGTYRGPLHGVPYALKDIYDTAGIATTAQSWVGQGRVPGRDAFTQRKLREAGAVLVGKLATHEFAYGGPSFDLPAPPARNPWSRERFTGGSSSGSGVAVAAGLVPGALGSDTGGSIRHPAAHCGIVGLKPTAGLVGRSGVIPLSFSFDTCGPMAWTVEDCALMLQAIAGPDADDPQSVSVPIPDYRSAIGRDIRGLRIGVVRHFYEADKPTDAPIKAAIEAALKVLAGLGAEVEDIRLAPLDDYAACQWVITCAEANALHDEDLRHRLTDYGENFRYRILPGAAVSAVEYVQAQRMRRALIAETQAKMAKVDVLLTATVPTVAPAVDSMTLSSVLSSRGITSAFNTLGYPALAQCCGFTEAGVPLSLTVAGKPFDEMTVLRVADAYEKATPWRQRRPELAAA
jgi:aspartyl-tRNA(Asn)/glutamyl-tRNA(Gln) amidotransferase subunit A